MDSLYIVSRRTKTRLVNGWLLASAFCLPVMQVCADITADEDPGLAQELTNPIADLVTVPIQINFDNDIGPGEDGEKITTNVQPVIPFDVGENWNLITRTIVPVIYQDDVVPGE